jgi:hypothetical protein
MRPGKRAGKPEKENVPPTLIGTPLVAEQALTRPKCVKISPTRRVIDLISITLNSFDAPDACLLDNPAHARSLKLHRCLGRKLLAKR